MALWDVAAGDILFRRHDRSRPSPAWSEPWIDDDIDLINVRETACAVHVGNFNEFWWFFPQLGQPYNTRCMIFTITRKVGSPRD